MAHQASVATQQNAFVDSVKDSLGKLIATYK